MKRKGKYGCILWHIWQFLLTHHSIRWRCFLKMIALVDYSTKSTVPLGYFCVFFSHPKCSCLVPLLPNILPFLPISPFQFASNPFTSHIVTTNSQKLLTLKNSMNTTLSWASFTHKDDYWTPHSPHCWSKQRNTLADILLFASMIPHLTHTHNFFTNPHTPKFHPITIFHHPQ